MALSGCRRRCGAERPFRFVRAAMWTSSACRVMAGPTVRPARRGVQDRLGMGAMRMGLGLGPAVPRVCTTADARGGSHVAAGRSRGMSHHVVIGADPFRRPNPRLVVAVCRAGGLGVLDLDGDGGAGDDITAVADRSDAPFAVRPRSIATLADIALPPQVMTVVAPA